MKMNRKILVLLSVVLLMASIVPVALAQPQEFPKPEATEMPISEFPKPFVSDGNIDYDGDGVPDVSLIIGSVGATPDVIGAAMVSAKIGTNMYWSAANITLREQYFGTAEPFKIWEGGAKIHRYSWLMDSLVLDTYKSDYFTTMDYEITAASYGTSTPAHGWKTQTVDFFTGGTDLYKHLAWYHFVSDEDNDDVYLEDTYLLYKWLYSERSAVPVGEPDYYIWWYPPGTMTVTSPITGLSYTIPGVADTGKSGRFMLPIRAYLIGEKIPIPFLGDGYYAEIVDINVTNWTQTVDEWVDPYIRTYYPQSFWTYTVASATVWMHLGYNGYTLNSFKFDYPSGPTWVAWNFHEMMFGPNTNLTKSVIVEVKAVLTSGQGAFLNITSWPLEKHFTTFTIGGTEYVRAQMSFTQPHWYTQTKYDVFGISPDDYDMTNESVSVVNRPAWYVIPVQGDTPDSHTFYTAKEVHVFVDSWEAPSYVERDFFLGPSAQEEWSPPTVDVTWDSPAVDVYVNFVYWGKWMLNETKEVDGKYYFFGNLPGTPCSGDLEEVTTFWEFYNETFKLCEWICTNHTFTIDSKQVFGNWTLPLEGNFYNGYNYDATVVDYAAHLYELEGYLVSGVYEGYFDRFTPGPEEEYTGTTNIVANGTDVTPLAERDLVFQGEDVFSGVHRFVFLDTEEAAADALKTTHVILVGGPLVNKYVKELNDTGLLPITFIGNDRLLFANQIWTYENVTEALFGPAPAVEIPRLTSGLGVVEYATKNPWNEDKLAFVVAGTDRYGTFAASLALFDPTRIVRATAENWYRAGRTIEGKTYVNAVIVVGVIPTVPVVPVVPVPNLVAVGIAPAGVSVALGP